MRKYIVYLLFFLLYQGFHIVMIVAASSSDTYFEDNKTDGYSWIRGTRWVFSKRDCVEIMTIGDTLEFVVLSVAALLEPYFISRYCKCLESRQPKHSIDERG